MHFGDTVASVLNIMRNEKEVYKDYLPPSAIKAGEDLNHITNGLWEDVLPKVIGLIKKEIPLEYPHVAVWWYSVLLGIKKDRILFEEFIEYVINNRNAFSANTQYFLFYQLASLRFRFNSLDGKSKKLLWGYYKEIVETFAKSFPASLLRVIPEAERNSDFVLVITEQFIAVQHGPTKTALDRCKALMEKMGKQVLLINDAEVLSNVGYIPFFGAISGSYSPQKTSEKVQYWKGAEIPFYQCKNNMPNYQTIKELLQQVRDIAPGHVISIGKGGIFAQLVGKMVPMLTIGLCPSDLEYTCAKYQTLSRPLKADEIKMLNDLGQNEKNVIESVFTSSLKPQEEHITRKELGNISEHMFLMIVVGTRLDTEVSEDFLTMLEDIIEPDMYVGFLGKFEGYNNRIQKYTKLQTQSAYWGFCNDILSRMEVCDLFVNPTRKGGGTSCVEALYKGIPVVTTDYGDVAVNAGKDFCVADYGSMQGKIKLYHSDKSYYDDMSQKARERAKILLDTDGEFVRIIQEMDKREQSANT